MSPASHWLIEDYYDPDPRARDKTYAKRGHFSGVPFDAAAWGVPPAEFAGDRHGTAAGADRGAAGARGRLRGQFAELPRDRNPASSWG
jgi:hypothetical protein